MTLGNAYYKLCSTHLGYLAARTSRRALQAFGFLDKPYMPLDALDLDHESARGLMQLWQRIHWSSGDGMMPAEDLLAIYRLACSWPARGDIVELGAWVGLTTSYLGAACQVRGAGKVYAVDTFQGTKEDDDHYESIERFKGSTLETFNHQVDRAGVRDFVETIVGFTSEAVHRYSGGPIRLLFIDADHSYEGVRSDFEIWSPLVTMGGLIIFHDYHMPGVARFVDDDLKQLTNFVYSPGLVLPRVVAVTKRSTSPVNAKINDPAAKWTTSLNANTGSQTLPECTSC